MKMWYSVVPVNNFVCVSIVILSVAVILHKLAVYVKLFLVKTFFVIVSLNHYISILFQCTYSPCFATFPFVPLLTLNITFVFDVKVFV